ncbi:MAG: PEP-CTERM sorting domain-containing protein [Planctomycetota bacterium]
MHRISIFAATGVALAGATTGALASDSVSFLGSNLDPIIGSGISNDNFIIDTDPTSGIELGLKAHNRFVGDLARSGNVYTADTGTTLSPTNLLGSTWNVTWVIDFGGAPGALVYDIEWLMDFDPSAGSSYATLDVDNTAFFSGDAASTQLGASENALFNFWGVPFPGFVDASGHIPFDPNAIGTYDSILRIKEKGTENVVAEAQIFVNVVPAPGAVAMLGLGGLLAVRRRRAA